MKKMSLAKTRKIDADIYLKKLEQKLKYYKQVVIDSSDAIIIQDFKGTIKAWNKSAERIYGFKEKEMLGQNITKIIAKGYQTEAKRNIRAIRQGKPTFRVKQVRKTKEGQEVSVNITYSPIFENEEIIEIGTTEEDITELKISFAKLKESEEKFRKLVENIKDEYFVYAHDKKGVFYYVSPSIKRILGYSQKEFSKHYTAYLTDNSKKEVIRHTNLSIRGIGQPPYFVEIYHKDGSKRWLQVSEIPIFKDKKVVGVEGIARDITKQKKTEEDLKKAHDFSQSLIDTAQTIILVLSPEGKIISFNPYMEKVSGYKLTEVKGKDWFKTFLPKQDFSHIRVLFKKAISNIQTIGNVNPIVTKSRELVYIEWHDKTLKDRTGKVIGLLSIGLDVTKLKKAYDELKKIDELKSNAIRDLTHEFKTPVSKIQMASNILQAYIKDPVEKRENINKYLDIIKKNTAFAIRQVSQTLEFSKLQELEGIQKTPVIFCDLLKDMAKAYHPKKITIVTATHTDKKFKLNKEMMKTLVRNLLENAIKFTKKGTIRLSCSFKDNNLVFAVEDTGIGIRKEDMEQVKKPFTQLDPSIQGMGIGLALCQKIVQLHSGTLDIMSTFGKGTKVTIMIPEAKHEKKHIDS